MRTNHLIDLTIDRSAMIQGYWWNPSIILLWVDVCRSQRLTIHSLFFNKLIICLIDQFSRHEVSGAGNSALLTLGCAPCKL
uniref:Ovule protein n=1 Tax=Haemonchus contortus TaxID=6289 RepID=A0A7I4YW73_HAECO